jgi:alkylation response protein AidB-like acyl-CoA dehydrogenase
LFVVYVRFSDEPGTRPIGAVLIERNTPGFEISRGNKTLGGEDLYDLTFEECRIPTENVLVREDGFKRMLTAFNGQRCLNASISIGLAQGAQDAAIAYAKERVQGGKRLADHQGIQWMLADNEIEIQAARQLVWRAAAKAAGGFPTRVDAAVAKVFSNEMALRVTDRCLQVFGGHGWLRELPAERYLRWARYGPLGGGTPQIQRNGIARRLLK